MWSIDTEDRSFSAPLSHRLEGRALLFAIVLTVLLGSIASSFIFHRMLEQRLVDRSLEGIRGVERVRAGILYLKENKEVPLGEHVEKDLFGTGQPTELERERWGVYEVLTAKSSFKEGKLQRSALVGLEESADPGLALYLTDRGEPLSIGGNTLIRGDARLPEQGVERAYIQGTSYTRSELIFGKERVSGDELPPLKKELLRRLKRDLVQGPKGEDIERRSAELLRDKDTIKRSFSGPSLLIRSSKDLLIDDVWVEGNVIIRGLGDVRVTPSAELRDVRVLGKEVSIERGFSGRLQVFARDTLTVGKEVELGYPSSAAVLYPRQSKGGAMFLREGASLEGSALVTSPSQKGMGDGRIEVRENAKVRGELYTNGELELKGTVEGVVYVGGFILETPSGVYRDHLFNARIDRSALPPEFVFSDLLKGERRGRAVIDHYHSNDETTSREQHS